MSHFTVVVMMEEGQTIEDLLAPYDENIVVERYIEHTKQELIDKGKKEIEDYKNGVYAQYKQNPKAYNDSKNEEHIKYLRYKFPRKLKWTDEQIHKDQTRWYSKKDIGKGGEVYSTYNPKSKWDWWRVGGRWDGCMLKLPAIDDGNGGFNFDGKFETPERNSCKVSEIADDFVPFAFVTPDGVWHARAKMGWWAITRDEKDETKWKDEFRAAKNMYNKATATLVACHI